MSGDDVGGITMSGDDGMSGVGGESGVVCGEDVGRAGGVDMSYGVVSEWNYMAGSGAEEETGDGSASRTWIAVVMVWEL